MIGNTWLVSYDAVVIGSGPNGLTAAALLARRGLRVVVFEADDTVGGGCRSAELTEPGFVHDVCAAVHPLGAASPAFRQLDLEHHGVRFLHAAVPLAHPLDDRPAVLMHRDIDRTADGLDAGDGGVWRHLMAPFTRHGSSFVDGMLSPLGRPAHPVALARFGLNAAMPVTTIARRFSGARGPALFAGIAAHGCRPLHQRFTSMVGLALGGVVNVAGWPVIEGGSQRLTDALVSIISGAGGELVTGTTIASLDDLPPARATFADIGPLALARLAGDRLSPRHRRSLDRYRYANAIFKVDWALSERVPWSDPDVAEATTVHLGGGISEVIRSLHTATSGVAADTPFLIVAQPSIVDPSRAPAGRSVLWAYCHVPSRYPLDVTASIEAQIERFAPGFRDTIIARHARGPADLEAHNANYLGGDITGGVIDVQQLVGRPLRSRSPWTMPIDDVYLCSSSTLPGAGVHGMCGAHAVRAALSRSLRD